MSKKSSSESKNVVYLVAEQDRARQWWYEDEVEFLSRDEIISGFKLYVSSEAAISDRPIWTVFEDTGNESDKVLVSTFRFKSSKDSDSSQMSTLFRKPQSPIKMKETSLGRLLISPLPSAPKASSKRPSLHHKSSKINYDYRIPIPDGNFDAHVAELSAQVSLLTHFRLMPSGGYISLDLEAMNATRDYFCVKFNWIAENGQHLVDVFETFVTRLQMAMSNLGFFPPSKVGTKTDTSFINHIKHFQVEFNTKAENTRKTTFALMASSPYISPITPNSSHNSLMFSNSSLSTTEKEPTNDTLSAHSGSAGSSPATTPILSTQSSASGGTLTTPQIMASEETSKLLKTDGRLDRHTVFAVFGSVLSLKANLEILGFTPPVDPFKSSKRIRSILKAIKGTLNSNNEISSLNEVPSIVEELASAHRKHLELGVTTPSSLKSNLQRTLDVAEQLSRQQKAGEKKSRSSSKRPTLEHSPPSNADTAALEGSPPQIASLPIMIANSKTSYKQDTPSPSKLNETTLIHGSPNATSPLGSPINSPDIPRRFATAPHLLTPRSDASKSPRNQHDDGSSHIHNNPSHVSSSGTSSHNFGNKSHDRDTYFVADIEHFKSTGLWNEEIEIVDINVILHGYQLYLDPQYALSSERPATLLIHTGNQKDTVTGMTIRKCPRKDNSQSSPLWSYYTHLHSAETQSHHHTNHSNNGSHTNNHRIFSVPNTFDKLLPLIDTVDPRLPLVAPAIQSSNNNEFIHQQQSTVPPAPISDNRPSGSPPPQPSNATSSPNNATNYKNAISHSPPTSPRGRRGSGNPERPRKLSSSPAPNAVGISSPHQSHDSTQANQPDSSQLEHKEAKQFCAVAPTLFRPQHPPRLIQTEVGLVNVEQSTAEFLLANGCIYCPDGLAYPALNTIKFQLTLARLGCQARDFVISLSNENLRSQDMFYLKYKIDRTVQNIREAVFELIRKLHLALIALGCTPLNRTVHYYTDTLMKGVIAFEKMYSEAIENPDKHFRLGGNMSFQLYEEIISEAREFHQSLLSLGYQVKADPFEDPLEFHKFVLQFKEDQLSKSHSTASISISNTASTSTSSSTPTILPQSFSPNAGTSKVATDITESISSPSSAPQLTIISSPIQVRIQRSKLSSNPNGNPSSSPTFLASSTNAVTKPSGLTKIKSPISQSSDFVLNSPLFSNSNNIDDPRGSPMLLPSGHLHDIEFGASLDSKFKDAVEKHEDLQRRYITLEESYCQLQEDVVEANAALQFLEEKYRESMDSHEALQRDFTHINKIAGENDVAMQTLLQHVASLEAKLQHLQRTSQKSLLNQILWYLILLVLYLLLLPILLGCFLYDRYREKFNKVVVNDTNSVRLRMQRYARHQMKKLELIVDNLDDQVARWAGFDKNTI